jgi:hypothetical protein
LRGWLTEQLDVARQRVAKLAPAGEEVASLQIREANALRDADEANKMFAALAERARLDATEGARQVASNHGKAPAGAWRRPSADQ